MPKTRRAGAKKQGTMRSHRKCCETTFQGLHEWTHEKFEKLGWMILAKKKGHMDKVNEYLNSLNRLKQAIEEKHMDMRDKDKKDDLEIMLYNVNVLCEHAEKDLK